MGTRSLTLVMGEEGTEVVCMYRQYDGHVEGHGTDLIDFLQPRRLTNGYSSDERDDEDISNGMGCLAATLVGHFKDPGPGNIYLHAPGTRDVGEEYIYRVYEEDGEICLRVVTGCMTAFGMPGTKEANMPVLFDGPVNKWVLSGVLAAQKLAREKGIPNDFLESQTQEA